ncbi:MAG: carbohydrate ABC transporter permease [Herbinix sp.]|nr:carbohydrate ABC transporter permease [Herbinix sp.]
MKVKGRKKKSIKSIIAFLLFLAFAVINVYPLVFSIFCSLKGNLEIFSSFTALPKHFLYENYITAWKVGNIGKYFLNTIILAAGTLFVSGFFGAMAAYILARFTFKFKTGIYLYFITGLMIPIQAVLIPLSYIFGKTGMTNNYYMLIMLYSAFCFPMTVLIMTGFMNNIPTELEEAMIIDGATIRQVFLKMILKLSLPGMISISVFNFIQVWNNLLFPLIFISDKTKGTISMGLLAFFGEYSTNYSASMAGICLTTIPVIIIYVLFQDKIENGLMSGAVKG